MSQNMVVISIHLFQKKVFLKKMKTFVMRFLLKKVHFSTETEAFYCY